MIIFEGTSLVLKSFLKQKKENVESMALGTQLVDLRSRDVCSLFSFIKLVLNLAEFCKIAVGLFLLQNINNMYV